MTDQQDPSRTELHVRLKLESEELLVRVAVPTAPVRPLDLLPMFQLLDNAIVDAAVEAVQREGKTVSCRAGCGACCRQLVPVSHTEARALVEAMAALPEEHRLRVIQRIQSAYAFLAGRGLLERLREGPQLADEDDIGRLARDYFQAGVACPFLEDESCSIYPYRPLSCREYLVTSPAEQCREPERQGVEKVPLYARASRVLMRFNDGQGRDDVRWLPLVLSFEWAVTHRDDPQPGLPGDQMFANFLDRLAEGTR